MKFRFNKNEIQLLNELELGVFAVCPLDVYNTADLTGTQVRDMIQDLFDCIPLLNDKNDQWILSNLGWRLTKNCL